MARTRKIAASKAPETAEAGIKEILSSSIEKTLEEAAAYVSVSIFKLQEMFCDRLGKDSPTGWETIPTEHEPLLEEFKRQMDAAATVQSYAPQLPQSEPEVDIPLIRDEVPQVPAGKLDKPKSTKLTQERVEATQQTIHDTVILEDGIHETELDAATEEGIQDGSQLGTTYLMAKQVTENKIRKEGAKRRVAKTIQKTAKQKDFNPLTQLQKHGLNPTADDIQELNDLATPAMGTVGNATREILANSWVNGLSVDCTDLTALMSDGWSE